VSEEVRLEIEGHLATVTLDRPGKLNALTAPMLEALEAAADRIDRHP
jgi:enoyl-CoA hydratase/carnithine racemase